LTVLANGRISQRSFGRYRLLGRPLRRAIADFSLMVMQSEADAERARLLGAAANCVRVCGNLKYDQPGDRGRGPGIREATQDGSNSHSPGPNSHRDIDQQFALSLSSNLIVAGSTAPGEEEMLLAALREVRGHDGLEDARLLLAPRHPERFDEVARLIARSGFAFARRSESRDASDTRVQRAGARVGESNIKTPLTPDEASGYRAADVILLDTIGELAAIYRFAAVVFVGGSLVPRGGHNIIEPAAFAKPIIVGPHTENFRQIVSDFLDADAVIQIDAGKDAAGRFARELTGLLSDRDQARAVGERARDILLKNKGATDCTIAMIKEAMKIDA